jgi:hypothetical protein
MIVELILGPDIHRDLRGFCLFLIKLSFSTIGKKIRSTIMPCLHAYFFCNAPSLLPG